jgi:hypothetical protein
VLDERVPGRLERRVLKCLAKMPEVVQDTVEAEMALSAAGEIDAGRQLSIAPVMKELRSLMELLRSWSTAQTDSGDDVDDLAARRAERRAGAAG